MSRLRGSKAAELPTANAGLIEIAINLKTAKALGLTVPDHDAQARGIKRLRRQSHETVKPRPIDLASDIRAKFGMI